VLGELANLVAASSSRSRPKPVGCATSTHAAGRSLTRTALRISCKWTALRRSASVFDRASEVSFTPHTNVGEVSNYPSSRPEN